MASLTVFELLKVLTALMRPMAPMDDEVLDVDAGVLKAAGYVDHQAQVVLYEPRARGLVAGVQRGDGLGLLLRGRAAAGACRCRLCSVWAP